MLKPWRLSARVRLVDAGGYDQLVHLDDGTDRWPMWLLEDGVDTRDQNANWLDVTTDGDYDLTADYHLLEMVYDPVAAGTKNPGDEVTFFVDGIEVSSITRDLTENRADSPQIRFGGASSGGTGQANWNFVEFAVIPEPSTLLLALGALAMLVLRRK